MWKSVRTQQCVTLNYPLKREVVKKKEKKEAQEEEKDEKGGMCGGQKQRGRFMASWHCVCSLLNKHDKCESCALLSFFFHRKGKEGRVAAEFTKTCFLSAIIVWRLGLFHKGQLQELVWGKRGREMASTLTRLISRILVRDYRRVHRLKLSKYERSETGPVRIADTPHVP